MIAITLITAASGGDGVLSTAPSPTPRPASTATAATTSTTTTTSTGTTTTLPATTTTLSLEEHDELLAISLWEGLSSAWALGAEPAARFIADHTYPGWPAAYEDCLRPELPAGWATYRITMETTTVEG